MTSIERNLAKVTMNIFLIEGVSDELEELDLGESPRGGHVFEPPSYPQAV